MLVRRVDELAQLRSLASRSVGVSAIPDMASRTEWAGVSASARNKQAVSLRLGPDVLDYFRGTGRRYQTLINNVLRAYVDAQLKKNAG